MINEVGFYLNYWVFYVYNGADIINFDFEVSFIIKLISLLPTVLHGFHWSGKSGSTWKTDQKCGMSQKNDWI